MRSSVSAATRSDTEISIGRADAQTLDVRGPSIDSFRDDIQRAQRNPAPQNLMIASNVQQGGEINLNGRSSITKDEAFNSLPTPAGIRLANALINRPGVGNDYSYTPGEDGRCLEKVNDAMNSVGMPIERKAWAIQSVSALRASKDYVEVQGPISQSDLDRFPVGTVYVAEKGGHGQSAPGHIAVKVQDKGSNDWCSDFRHKAVVYSAGYDKIWVFIPKGDAQTLQTQSGAGASGGSQAAPVAPVTPPPAATPPASNPAEVRARGAEQYEAIRSGRAPMPAYGQGGPAIEMLKEDLNYLRSRSPQLQQLIPAQGGGAAFDVQAMTAFTNLRQTLGYPQPNPMKQETFGALDLNIVNGLMNRYGGQARPIDPGVGAALYQRQL